MRIAPVGLAYRSATGRHTVYHKFSGTLVICVHFACTRVFYKPVSLCPLLSWLISSALRCH